MNSTLIDNRQIRVFISSTFQDMQDERDYLMKRTFPKLRKLAAERDVTLTEVDLRWGITPEESASGRVVEICLNEIENTVPFFVGIIGNRYGWVPEQKDLGGRVLERFPEVCSYVDRHLSVTEMEMQYGVLERPEDMHAYFFMKEQETEADDPAQLARLKEAVHRSPYPCCTYSSLEDLGQQVELAFVGLMNQLFPKKHLTEHEKQQQAQRVCLKRLLEGHIRIEDNLRIIDDFLSGEEHTLILANRGTGGLSATVADYIASGRYQEKYSLIYYFVGAGGSFDPDKAMAYIMTESSGSEEFVFDPSSGSFRIVARTKPILLIVDGFDHLEGDVSLLLDYIIYQSDRLILADGISDFSEWSPRLEQFYEWNPEWDAPLLAIRELTVYEREHLIVSTLAQYHKRLTSGQLARICASPFMEDLHVLKNMINELVRFGDYDRLDERIDYFLQPQTIMGFYTAVLLTYEDDFASYGERFVGDILEAVLSALPEMKLTEKALVEALGLKPIQWSEFYNSFADYLQVVDGCLTFRNMGWGGMYSAVRERYCDTDNELILNKLRAYFGIEEPACEMPLTADLSTSELDDWEKAEIDAIRAERQAWEQAEAAIRDGRIQEAIDFYMDNIPPGHIEENSSTEWECYEHLLSAYRELGKQEESFHWAEACVRYFWAEPKSHLYMAEELDRSGRHDEAEKHREIARKLNRAKQ